LGDAQTNYEKLMLWLSFSKYETMHYNKNGKNIYTWKGTVFLSLLLIIFVPIMSMKYVLPMITNDTVRSEFNRRKLSNVIGLVSNETYSPTFFEDHEQFSLWKKFSDVMGHDSSI
jgi:hypothetical protein